MKKLIVAKRLKFKELLIEFLLF